MNVTSTSHRLDDVWRERAVIALILLAALAFGVFAALGTSEWLATVGIVALTCTVAMTVPLPLLPVILATLIPFQIYFFIGSSSFTLRVAFVFELFAALRLLVRRVDHREIVRSQPWMLPAALFSLAAFAAALGAQDKYQAFKGIYEWLAVFGAAFVVSELVSFAPSLRRIVFVLIAGGVIEALLGLLQYVAGIDVVIFALRQPASEIFFQPNLLREGLAEFSFNWMIFDRAAPFGTFINAIDYAIFIAAILALVTSLIPARRGPIPLSVLFLGALSLGGALLLTFKASGLIAFAGGAATVALFSPWGSRGRKSSRGGNPEGLEREDARDDLRGVRDLPRFSAWTIAVVFACLALLFVVLFGDLIGQRLVFLVLREQGTFGTWGRLETWGNLIQFLPQRPLFGFGLNNAPFLVEPARTLRGGITAFNPTSPESAYVAALIETGAVGFIALISLFTIVVARAYQNIRESAEPAIHIGILAAMVALLLGNLTLTGLTTDQNGMLLGVLIGLVYGNWKRL